MKNLTVLIVVIVLSLVCCPVFAYNPNSFQDEEELTVNGNRPKVDVELSEITVTIDAEDFQDGVFKKEIIISNDGNVPCYLEIEVQNVPVDLKVDAQLGTDRLHKGESTELTFTVELTDQQETESFMFKILVKATLN